MKQLALIKNSSQSYGGELLKTRKGRSQPRPLATKNTMHLVFRSSKAKGDWSFRRSKNAEKISAIIKKFSIRFGVRVISSANVGNHLHFQIQLTKRETYRPFIRAVTASIAMAITGASRWQPLKRQPKDRFWDYRPFTRVIVGWRAILGLRDYIAMNRLEGFGYRKSEARILMASSRAVFLSG